MLAGRCWEPHCPGADDGHRAEAGKMMLRLGDMEEGAESVPCMASWWAGGIEMYGPVWMGLVFKWETKKIIEDTFHM